MAVAFVGVLSAIAYQGYRIGELREQNRGLEKQLEDADAGHTACISPVELDRLRLQAKELERLKAELAEIEALRREVGEAERQGAELADLRVERETLVEESAMAEAGMGMDVFGEASDSDKRIKCVSNLKNIGLGFGSTPRTMVIDLNQADLGRTGAMS